MKNDFQPVVGHRFNFRTPPMAHWNGVTLMIYPTFASRGP